MLLTTSTEPNAEISYRDKDDVCQLYIVVSQTGTILSRIIKLITRAKYNHVSLSLEKDLSTMYSFGRVNPYNPVLGGFVIESPKYGTFKRFKETEVIVLKFEITQQQKESLTKRLESMYRRRRIYHYNYIGLILAALHITYKKRNCFYCSEFVKDVLVRTSIFDEKIFEKIVHPMNFLKIKDADVIYSGKLRLFESH